MDLKLRKCISEHQGTITSQNTDDENVLKSAAVFHCFNMSDEQMKITVQLLHSCNEGSTMNKLEAAHAK